MDMANRQAIPVPGGLDLASILLRALEIDASDVHLAVGEPPCFRLDGRIVPSALPALDATALHHLLYDLLADDQRRVLETEKELDFALQLGEAARFRANCYHTMKGEGAAFRVVPGRMRSFDELGLPRVLKKVCSRPRGMVLVTGPTGSGKSTTLAAMVDHINETRDDHIITIEDPIEFVHRNKRCLVNQRELGSSTKSFSAALRSALREDPDIILVGEMRDLETIRLALTASETGHLVLGTLHTTSAPKTVDRIVDVFPAEQQKLVRLLFAENFEAIICQALVPRADGRGRVLAMEIMLGTPSSRSMIREGKTHQLETVLQTSAKLGMQSLDANLKDLRNRGIISEYTALSRANNPEAVVRNGAARLEELLAAQDADGSAAQAAAPAPAIAPTQGPPPAQGPPPTQAAAGFAASPPGASVPQPPPLPDATQSPPPQPAPPESESPQPPPRISRPAFPFEPRR